MDTQKAWLSYLFGWISGLILFLTEKEDKFVRFHAMQSILLSAAVYVGSLLAIIPIIGILIDALLWLGFIACWIISMVKASKGEWHKWPVIGDWAMNIIR